MNRKLPRNMLNDPYTDNQGNKRNKYRTRFTDWKGIRRNFQWGEDYQWACQEHQRVMTQKRERFDFDAPPPASALLFSAWAKLYPDQPGVAGRRSLATKITLIEHHLVPYFGNTPLTDFTREQLLAYIKTRMGQTLVRNGKYGRVAVKRGTVSNELSLLRHMLNVAEREGVKVSVPSFNQLIDRTKRGGRALGDEELPKILALLPRWLARLVEFAIETCLSEGDILRLTPAMVNRKVGVIQPTGGRLKAQGTTDGENLQVAPLTDRARAILDEIEADKKSGKIVANAAKLFFTRDDGKLISRDMISRGIKRAWKAAGVPRFTFHSTRHTAVTQWIRRGLNTDIAMRAAGHKSVQMHKIYADLQPEHIAAAFQNLPIDRGLTGKT